MQFWILPVAGGLRSCLKMFLVPGFRHHFLRALDWPGRTTLQQDPSAHVYWESLIVEAKRLRAQNWCCFYRPRRGVSHTRIGYALSLICMFLIWLATLSQYLTEPHYHTSFACLTSDWLYSQYLTEPHYHAWARQCLCKKLYCICTHWLFVQSYAWWPAVVSATQQRHMWLPTDSVSVLMYISKLMLYKKENNFFFHSLYPEFSVPCSTLSMPSSHQYLFHFRLSVENNKLPIERNQIEPIKIYWYEANLLFPSWTCLTDGRKGVINQRLCQHLLRCSNTCISFCLFI